MDYHITWSPRAASHLEEICAYIARDSKHYAAIFAQNVLKLVASIPSFPKSGRVVPEYSDENIREHLYQNYRIVYRIAKDSIQIAAICHGARQLTNTM